MPAESTKPEGAGGHGLLSREHRNLSIAIYITIALVAFEGTSVAAALPELAADLGDVGRLPWVITAFLFALGLSTVVAGPLVDAIGSRRLFFWSALAFAITGFLAGLAPTLDVLIAIRLAQGVASGVLFGATLAAVNLGFPPSLIARAFAANSTIWGVVGAAAPAIAAVMLSVSSWRWIFFINLPLGAIALIAGRTAMPERQPGAEPLSVDVRGVAFAAVFTLASIATVDQLGAQSLAFAALAVASVVGYARHARRTERPVIALAHIAEQPFRSIAAVPSLMLTAAFTTNVYVTVYVAAGRDVSNGLAAFSVLFFTIGWTIGANTSSLLMRRTTATSVMSVGLVAGIAGTTVVVVGVGTNTALAVAFGGLLILGVGIGLTTNASLVILRAATPPAQIGRASAANQFARSQGFTLGAASGGAILLFVVDRRLGSVDPIRTLLSGDELDSSVFTETAVAEAVRSGFAAATITSLVVMIAAIPAMRSLHRYRATENALADWPSADDTAGRRIA
ncbi:MAG: MFS transporter [Ilumatobacter sp.]